MEAVAGRRGEETGAVVEDRGGEVGRREAAEGHSLERGEVAAEVCPGENRILELIYQFIVYSLQFIVYIITLADSSLSSHRIVIFSSSSRRRRTHAGRSMWRGEGGRRGEVVRGGGEVRLPYDRERERREQERRQRQQDTKRQVINWQNGLFLALTLEAYQ